MHGSGTLLHWPVNCKLTRILEHMIPAIAWGTETKTKIRNYANPRQDLAMASLPEVLEGTGQKCLKEGEGGCGGPRVANPKGGAWDCHAREMERRGRGIGPSH